MLLASIQASLKERGWELVPYYAIGRKYFDTAVGRKQCLVNASSNANVVTLTAEYVSEGRNVCSTCWVQIFDVDSTDVLESKVKAFDKEISSFVDKSYARGLYLNRCNFSVA